VYLLDSIQSIMENLEKDLIRQIQSHVPVAVEIGAHILQSGGKRIRPQMAVISARMGGYEGENVIKLSGAIEAIHTASLLHDDVIDDADSRRGLPAANTVWPNEMCIIAGDFLIARALSALVSIGNMRILQIVCKAAERLSEGELFQMKNIGNVDLTEEDYHQIVVDKTAVLMEVACRGGSILGNLNPEQEEALAQFGYNLGIAFQMTDDVIDYKSEKAVMGKTPGNDLREGKLTLPLILALKDANPGEKDKMAGILQERRSSDGDLEWVRELLIRRGGIEKALEVGSRYLRTAAEQLVIFPDSEEKRALQKLAEKILRRTY
jgi:octaprenyl-diphosphate synthase